MEKLKKSYIAKTICYWLIPMLILFIIINSVSLVIYSIYPDEILNYEGYENTEKFANNYFQIIKRAVRIVNNEKEYIRENTNLMISNAQYQTETSKDKANEEIIEIDMYNKETSGIQHNFETIRNYDILIITSEGDIITNVTKASNKNTVEKIKKYILSKPYYWKYTSKTVETNIEKLKYENISYDDLLEIEESGYEIYTSLREESGEICAYNLLYNIASNTYNYSLSNLIILSTLLIICIIYIIISIGHKKGEDGIYQDGLDKIPYEVVMAITGILFIIEFFVLTISLKFVGTMENKVKFDSGITLSIFMGFVIYSTLAIFLVTTIRRIKAHTFWKNTLIYQFFKFMFEGLFTNINQTAKLLIQYIGFIIISMLIPRDSIMGIMILIGFWYYIFKKILNNTNQISKIRQKISNMYYGNINEELSEEEFKGELKQIAKELNDISGGLSNAIEEAMKSERLKTELITNVSHDIKTPLTSIINYVDLMKKENIENEKVKEYLQVLDNKSQRLKKLTEDLVEASKASSGNIQLNMEKLNVKELIKQVRGEFEDKFEKRGLEIIESFPQEDIYIEADSRYMYRVMENMYVNISKYSLENSRVYVDIKKEKNKTKIELKNISQDKLNISVEELMQRFVRGDSARITEGSGLGISIAKSLTELQKGKFNIYLDGDLFKVVIEFEIIE